MSKFEILNQETIQGVTYEITTLKDPEKGVIIVKDVLENSKIIDTVYTSEGGYEIDDPALAEEIEDFLAEKVA